MFCIPSVKSAHGNKDQEKSVLCFFHLVNVWTMQSCINMYNLKGHWIKSWPRWRMERGLAGLFNLNFSPNFHFPSSSCEVTGNMSRSDDVSVIRTREKKTQKQMNLFLCFCHCSCRLWYSNVYWDMWIQQMSSCCQQLLQSTREHCNCHRGKTKPRATPSGETMTWRINPKTVSFSGIAQKSLHWSRTQQLSFLLVWTDDSTSLLSQKHVYCH